MFLFNAEKIHDAYLFDLASKRNLFRYPFFTYLSIFPSKNLTYLPFSKMYYFRLLKSGACETNLISSLYILITVVALMWTDAFTFWKSTFLRYIRSSFFIDMTFNYFNYTL